MLYLINSLLKLQTEEDKTSCCWETYSLVLFVVEISILQSLKDFSMDVKWASMVESLLSEIFLNESNVGMSAEYFFKVGRT